MPQCVFWNFTAVYAQINTILTVFVSSNPTCIFRLQNGSWSNAGVVTSSISYANSTVSIGCTSTHLTSFAILVDVAGGLQVCFIESMIWQYLCLGLAGGINQRACSS